MKRTFLTLGLSAMLAMPFVATGQQTPGMTGEPGVTGSGPGARTEQHQQFGQQGMDQEQVRKAQKRLQEVGFDPGPIDGLFGPQTQAALREFQSAHGLPQTGQLDASTRAALMDEDMPGAPGTATPGARPMGEPMPAPTTPGGTSPGR